MEEPRIVDIIHREVNKVSHSLQGDFDVKSPFQNIIATVFDKAPALYDFLDKATHREGRTDTRDFFITAAVNVLLFRKSQRSNWMQKQLSLFLLYHRCPKSVFGVLHRCGISLSYTASLEALRELAKGCLEKLALWHSQGKQLMVVVDNINFGINASEEVSTNKGKIVDANIGFVATLRVPNPVNTTEETTRPQLSNPNALRNYFYRQTDEEVLACRTTLVQLIGRVWAAHIPQLAFLKPLVDKVLTHAYSEHTRKVTEMQGTEILFLNQNLSDHNPAIMDYFSFDSIYVPADDDKLHKWARKQKPIRLLPRSASLCF